MIRINLLPVKQVRKAREGQRQLLLFAGLLVVMVAAMFFLYGWKQGEVEDRKKEAARLRDEIESLKKEVGDFDKLRAQRDRLVAQRNVITKLQKGRTGPVYMLRELSDILTPGKGPTVDQDSYEALIKADPTQGFNPRWNPRRLWLQQLDERGGSIKLLGKAKDYDDVAELTKRLGLSTFFHKVQLGRQDQVLDSGLGLKVVRFSMTAQAKY